LRTAAATVDDGDPSAFFKPSATASNDPGFFFKVAKELKKYKVCTTHSNGNSPYSLSQPVNKTMKYISIVEWAIYEFSLCQIKNQT